MALAEVGCLMSPVHLLPPVGTWPPREPPSPTGYAIAFTLGFLTSVFLHALAML